MKLRVQNIDDGGGGFDDDARPAPAHVVLCELLSPSLDSHDHRDPCPCLGLGLSLSSTAVVMMIMIVTE